MPHMNPKNPMMESGKQPPMGLSDLMGNDFQNRDKSMYQPMVEADVSQLMSEDFQNRDRSGGYDQMVSAQQGVPSAEGKSMYPQFQQGSTTGNQIKQLREMVQGQRQGGGMMGQQPSQQPQMGEQPMHQMPDGTMMPGATHQVDAGPDDVYRAIMGG